jgi:uncharacterized Tic20 family protein
VAFVHGKAKENFTNVTAWLREIIYAYFAIICINIIFGPLVVWRKQKK